MLIVTPTAVLAQTPSVLSTLPTQNQLSVSISTDISVTFDTDMNAATITASTLSVNGMSTGPHAGAISYEPLTRTAILSPTADFVEGEIITVVLTGGIESSGGQALVGYAWSFTTMAAPAPAVFPVHSDTPPAFGLRSVCAADLDGDGDLDLATGDGVSGGPMGAPAYVFMNLGDGTFAEQVLYWVGSVAWPVVASDLDGDGDLDLAVGSYNDLELSVLPNNGDGTFAADVTFSISYGATSLFAADLDTDGDRDLAVGYWARGFVSVLLNDGDGTFATRTDYAAGDGTRSVVAADLDGDADLDLAVTDVGSDLVSVLMNHGDGTFADRTTYPAGDSPAWVCAGDLDGDGDLDLAVANEISDDVTVLRNQGDGTFVSGVAYGLGWVGILPRGVFAADLDGDGDLDLATANYGSGNGQVGVSVLLNHGNGTYAAPVSHVTGDRPGSIFAADLDGDGDLDLAAANRDGPGVSVLVNDEPVGAPSASSSLVGFRIVSMSPTPFSRPLTVRFTLPEAMPVSAEIISVGGERIRRLASQVPFGPGEHHLTWDGRSDRGAPSGSGVYYVRLTTRLGAQSAQTVLVR